MSFYFQFIHWVGACIQSFHFGPNDLYRCRFIMCNLSMWFGKSVFIFQHLSNYSKFSYGLMHFQLMQNIGFGILFVLMLVSINILNLFLYCFFGKMATDSFKEMSICLYKTNWQNLPIDLQKFVVLMIGNAQRPLYYHGFGVAILDLETFTKVRIEFSN